MEIQQFEKRIKGLQDSAALFELTPPDESKSRHCRRELKLIKRLWDFVFFVESEIESWKKTPWPKIDCGSLEADCKNYGKDMRAFDKEVRMWTPYIYAENLLKNLMTSLRAITELRNPDIKERHWLELMHATKVRLLLSIIHPSF